MAKQSRTKSALGGEKKKKSAKPKQDSAPRVPEATKKYIDSAVKKALQRMHISPTANGQFLVDHEFKAEPGAPPVEGEQHAISPENLPAHVGEYLGLGSPVTPEPALPPDASAAPQLPLAAAAGPGPISPPQAGPMPLPAAPAGPLGV